MLEKIEWPSLSNLIGMVGISIVIWQLYVANKQREADALARILDTNRQLISLGFSHPELFSVLRDEKIANAKIEFFFLQLFLNHFSMAHAYMKPSFLRKERRVNLKYGIADFMRRANMRHHWESEGAYYPESFQTFVNQIIKEAGPLKAAQP